MHTTIKTIKRNLQHLRSTQVISNSEHQTIIDILEKAEKEKSQENKNTVCKELSELYKGKILHYTCSEHTHIFCYPSFKYQDGDYCTVYCDRYVYIRNYDKESEIRCKARNYFGMSLKELREECSPITIEEMGEIIKDAKFTNSEQLINFFKNDTEI